MKKKIVLIGIVICLIIIYSIYTLKNSNINQYELSLKDNKDIAVYVYDSDEENYIKQNSFPIGDYSLNETLSHCISGGEITGYDNANGIVNFNLIAGDTCYFYFDEVVEISSFSINGNTLYFEEGMTWEQWLNSEYNNTNLKVMCDSMIGFTSNLTFTKNNINNDNTKIVLLAIPSVPCAVTIDNIYYVSSSDLIVKNNNYGSYCTSNCVSFGGRT